MKLVLVTWLDAIQVDGSDEVAPDGPIGAVRHSVGWLLRRDEEGVVIAMSRDEHANRVAYEKGFGIPAAYIRKVKTLEEVK